MPALDQLLAPLPSESERVIVEAELVSKDGSLWGRVEGSSALWGPVEGTGTPGERVVLAIAQDGTPFVVWPVEGGGGGGSGEAEEWHTGSGAPSGALGDVGDFYLDSAGGNFYEKTGSSAWTLRGNLKGATGATGPAGPAGAAGAAGAIAVYEQPGIPEPPTRVVGSVWLDTDEEPDPIVAGLQAQRAGEFAPLLREGDPMTYSLSIQTTAVRFCSPRDFTCRSLGLARVTGDVVAHTFAWGFYDAAGDKFYEQTKANLFTRGHSGADVVALTLATPYDFEAGETIYIAFRSTTTISVYGVDMNAYTPGMLFQETLPTSIPTHGLSSAYELPYTEVLQVTADALTAPALADSIAEMPSPAGGIHFVQSVSNAPLIALREYEGNVAP